MTALPPPRIDLLVYSPTPSSLLPVLSNLLEPSPLLTTLLVPSLHAHLQSLLSTPSALPKTYEDLLGMARETASGWDIQDQAEFLASHPRIGETKGLSAASGVEQGESTGAAGLGTPGEVLKRLTILNSLYEESFPGLRYITFVNGRSRAAIIPELESILGLNLPPPSASTPEPSLTSLRESKSSNVRITGSKAWREELKRGTEALWDIAGARLNNWGVQ